MRLLRWGEGKRVELLELHALLREILVDPETRSWVLERRITSNCTKRAVAQSCGYGSKRLIMSFGEGRINHDDRASNGRERFG
jgi:hypothetical protein